MSPTRETSAEKQSRDKRACSSPYGMRDKYVVFTCSPSNRCGRRSLKRRSKSQNSWGVLSAVSRLSSTVSKLGYFSIVYLIACMVFFSSLSPGGGFMRPVAGVGGVSAAILCRMSPCIGARDVRADSRPNSARAAAGIHLSKSGRGVRGGLSHALPPGRLVPGAVRLPGTYIIPQFALFGNGGNGLFYGVYAGLRLLGCGLLCIL